MMIHLKNTSTQWLLLIQGICIAHYKKVHLFQLVATEIHAITKTVYCFNWLP